MRSAYRRAVWLAALAATPLLSGCGDDGPKRAVVRGKVSYNGKPVEEGTIRFLIDNRATAQGEIKGGAYKIDHLGGVPVGSGKVEIEGFQNTDKVVHNNPTGVKVYEAKQVLPPKYNKKTELTVEITEGENEKDFDLKP